MTDIREVFEHAVKRKYPHLKLDFVESDGYANALTQQTYEDFCFGYRVALQSHPAIGSGAEPLYVVVEDGPGPYSEFVEIETASGKSIFVNSEKRGRFRYIGPLAHPAPTAQDSEVPDHIGGTTEKVNRTENSDDGNQP